MPFFRNQRVQVVSAVRGAVPGRVYQVVDTMQTQPYIRLAGVGVGEWIPTSAVVNAEPVGTRPLPGPVDIPLPGLRQASATWGRRPVGKPVWFAPGGPLPLGVELLSRIPSRAGMVTIR